MVSASNRLRMLFVSILGGSVAIAASGCYDGIRPSGPGELSAGEDGGGAPDDGAGDGDDDGPVADPPADADLVIPSGLRRLTIDEVNNTLRDLVGDDTRPATTLLPPDLRTPFDNEFSGQVPTQALIEGADLLAAEVAERLVANPDRKAAVVGCTPSGPNDADCLTQFVERFGRLALRRPLSADEIDRYGSFLDFSLEENNFDVAVQAVVTAMLQEPEFLYRVEFGVPVEGAPETYKLTDLEMASRLSYLLWGSTPDDALLARAESRGLSTAEAVREAAEAMLSDSRAVDRVARFHAMWMGYEAMPHDPALVASMRAETRALIERVIFRDNRGWHDLLTSDETWVDDALADHYGIARPASSEGGWTSYDGTERAGLLSHGSFLSVGAKFSDTSPTQRGKAIRARLFCQPIMPPPPDSMVDTDSPPQAPGAVCKRERYAVLSEPGCGACHSLLDPVGFGLERYDNAGRFRTVEAGNPECPIDGEGELVGIGTFNGPAQLAALMLDSGHVNPCLVQQLHAFVAGRSAFVEADRAVARALAERLGDDNFSFKQLLLDVVAMDSFRYRRDETP